MSPKMNRFNRFNRYWIQNPKIIAFLLVAGIFSKDS